MNRPTFDAESRARNQRSLTTLGDPERWGGIAKIDFVVPKTITSRIEVAGDQFIRAQTTDLISRPWDWVCSWDIRTESGPITALGGVFGLRFTWGAGSSSQDGIIDLLGNAAGAAAIAGWVFDTFDATHFKGNSQAPWPLPAVSIAVVPFLRIDSNTFGDDVPVHFKVALTIAPRDVSR